VTLIARAIERRLRNRCRHYTSLAEGVCAVGVSYESVADRSERANQGTHWPCLDASPACKTSCPLKMPLTRAERVDLAETEQRLIEARKR
jgi:hypothetical protein